MKTVEAGSRIPFRAAQSAGPDAFGIVILPAGSALAPQDAPAERVSLRALLALTRRP